ncbi:hypothetical protein DSO57_1004624 [Entomophthora muscae]|uniref:Uncharacterized protein n=1 Tax=Entomophthora muscae TaxID=34485 RepID=A0ACC2SKS4_9FUNG|nr:hypothetical protein DSO57_1004624 [Entomophthora muscae]
MNHLIFTAVLTACLGIGGYQQGSEFFGPSQEGLGYDHHYDPGQLNSSTLVPGLPLYLHTPSCPSQWSFGRYNIHAKVFRWLMTVYPIVTALTGFQFSNLLPYLLQVVPTISGYYRRLLIYVQDGGDSGPSSCQLEDVSAQSMLLRGKAMQKVGRVLIDHGLGYSRTKWKFIVVISEAEKDGTFRVVLGSWVEIHNLVSARVKLGWGKVVCLNIPMVLSCSLVILDTLENVGTGVLRVSYRAGKVDWSG